MSVPIFVQIQKEAEVLNLVDTLKDELLNAKKLLHDLYDLRSQENAHLHDIKARIQEAQQRIAAVEEALANE